MLVQVAVSSSHGRPIGSSPSHSERQGRAAMHERSGQGCVSTGSMLIGDHGEQRQDYRGSCSQHGLLGKTLPWETLMGGVLSPEALGHKLGSLVLESPALFPVSSQLEEHSVRSLTFTETLRVETGVSGIWDLSPTSHCFYIRAPLSMELGSEVCLSADTWA